MHQDGLRLVVGGVAQRDSGCAHFSRNPRQKAITCHARAASSSERPPPARSAGTSAVPRVNGRSHSRAIAATNSASARGFVATQAVVQVGDVQAQVQLRRQTVQKMQQAERIGAARDRNDRAPRTQDLPALHKLAYICR